MKRQMSNDEFTAKIYTYVIFFLIVHVLSIEDDVHKNTMSTSLCSRKSEDVAPERANTDIELYPSNVIAMQNNCFIKPILGQKVSVKG